MNRKRQTVFASILFIITLEKGKKTINLQQNNIFPYQTEKGTASACSPVLPDGKNAISAETIFCIWISDAIQMEKALSFQFR